MYAVCSLKSLLRCSSRCGAEVRTEREQPHPPRFFNEGYQQRVGGAAAATAVIFDHKNMMPHQKISESRKCMKPLNNDYEGSEPITQRSQGPSLAVLPDCIFREVLAWIGKGEFLFIGTINRRFYKVYKKLTGNTRTSYASAFSSIPRSKMTLQQSDRLKFSACGTAARWGYLEVFKWARANGCEWDASTCASAARGGHLDVLKWARSNGCNWDYQVCMICAIHGHHPEIVKWIESQYGTNG